MGPYLALALPWDAGPNAVPPGTPGAIAIGGRVVDGGGDPVPDGLVETWQADPPASEAFRGFARCPTDADGRWEVLTLMPAPGGQAPHLDVSVFARGLLHRLATRIYFADRESENASDPVLASVPADRRATLLAVPEAERYRFDIRLQGPGETVFFDV